jgi:hypothetical protein
MDKNDFLKLAADPKYIPGICNYCDRWCERCPFTSRCLEDDGFFFPRAATADSELCGIVGEYSKKGRSAIPSGEGICEGGVRRNLK